MKVYFEKGYQANYALSGDVIKQVWDSATQASIVLSFHPVTAPVASKIGLVTYSAQLPFKVAAALLPSSIKAVDWGYTSVIENEEDTESGVWQDIVVTTKNALLT
jgi:hypothetical protein